MKTFIITIFCISSVFSVRNTEPYPITEPTTISYELIDADVAIVIWIDKSWSISNGNVPQVILSDIDPLVNLIDQINGTIAIGIIGETTRSEMAFYSHGSDKIQLPERKDNMSATDYGKELIAFKKRKERLKHLPDQKKKREDFEHAVKKMLDYTKMEDASLICEAVNVSRQIFRQENNKGGRKFLIMITDFINTGKESCPLKLDESISLLVVNRLSVTKDIMFTTSKHYVDIDSAVRYILDNA